MNTADTTRIDDDHPIIFSVLVSRLIYPNAQVPWHANAVLLAPVEDFRVPLAANSLVHFPFNAPLLLTGKYTLDTVTVQEILRLKPAGRGLPAQVFLVGELAPWIELQVKQLGYTTLRIGAGSPYQVAADIVRFGGSVIMEKKCDFTPVMVVSGENCREALPVAAYAAHSGTPVLYVTRQGLPAATARVLKELTAPVVYIVGSPQTVSENTAQQLEQLTGRKAARIGGQSPYEVAVNFAGFKDQITGFGWGRVAPGKGDAFSFVSVCLWQHAAAGGILGHLGKHAPVLIVEPHKLPVVVKDYILSLNPVRHEPDPPFMHGYVLGTEHAVSSRTQLELEEALMQRVIGHGS